MELSIVLLIRDKEFISYYFSFYRMLRKSNYIWRYLKIPNKFRKLHSLRTIFSAFNEPSIQRDGTSTVGLFGVDELKTSDGFHTLKEDVLKSAKQLVDQAVSASPSVDVVSIFDHLSNELCKVADLAEFIRLTHPEQSFVQAAENASFEIGGFVEKLNTNYSLYKSLKNSLLSNGNEMDSITQKVAELLLFDFEQSGIHLEKKKREIAVGLHQAILILGARFTEGSGLPRKYPVNCWPKDLSIPYKLEGDHMLADATYCESNDPRTREHCHHAYFYQCDDQGYLLDNLLHARYQLAVLLGFDTFSHRTLNGTMGAHPDMVNDFLVRTLTMLQQPVNEELKVLSDYKRTHDGLLDKMNAWDLRYYTNIITSQMYNLNSHKIREYFSVGACMHGLDLIFKSLFGVSLNVVTPEPGEMWSSLVQKLQVTDEKYGTLGYIYCDFYQRPGKLSQDSHFTIRGGKLLPDGSYQLPIICVNCNFPPPAGNHPTLLTQGMVENLFHEMGHAMHSMFARTRYQHVSGTRCATDFAEVPSILMEYFAMDARILPLYAKHYETGQSLPEQIIQMISLAKKQFSALDLHTQAFYSIVDQRFHGNHPLGYSTMDVLDKLHEEYSPLSHVPGACWHLRFNHFHSYAAKYYSYVWSKAVASQIWHSCFNKDPLSRTYGQRYRDTMLCHGGGKAPQQLVEDMLGCNLHVDDLVYALKEDLKK